MRKRAGRAIRLLVDRGGLTIVGADVLWRAIRGCAPRAPWPQTWKPKPKPRGMVRS